MLVARVTLLAAGLLQRASTLVATVPLLRRVYAALAHPTRPNTLDALRFCALFAVVLSADAALAPAWPFSPTPPFVKLVAALFRLAVACAIAAYASPEKLQKIHKVVILSVKRAIRVYVAATEPGSDDDDDDCFPTHFDNLSNVSNQQATGKSTRVPSRSLVEKYPKRLQPQHVPKHEFTESVGSNSRTTSATTSPLKIRRTCALSPKSPTAIPALNDQLSPNIDIGSSQPQDSGLQQSVSHPQPCDTRDPFSSVNSCKLTTTVVEPITPELHVNQSALKRTPSSLDATHHSVASLGTSRYDLSDQSLRQMDSAQIEAAAAFPDTAFVFQPRTQMPSPGQSKTNTSLSGNPMQLTNSPPVDDKPESAVMSSNLPDSVKGLHSDRVDLFPELSPVHVPDMSTSMSAEFVEQTEHLTKSPYPAQDTAEGAHVLTSVLHDEHQHVPPENALTLASDDEQSDVGEIEIIAPVKEYVSPEFLANADSLSVAEKARALDAWSTAQPKFRDASEITKDYSNVVKGAKSFHFKNNHEDLLNLDEIGEPTNVVQPRKDRVSASFVDEGIDETARKSLPVSAKVRALQAYVDDQPKFRPAKQPVPRRPPTSVSTMTQYS